MITKQIHILLIDDDETLLRLFGGYLEKARFELLYAHDGDEGWEMARRLHPDIMLLDLGLPGMDGYELSSRFKTNAITKDIPIIILTNADISLEAESLFKQKGIAAYLHKSVSSGKLIEQVNEVLNKKNK